MRFHRVLLIVNPVARTYSKPVLAVIEKALSADFRLEVAETKGRGHARELAAQAASEGVDMVAVLSGDGTINEAVNALGRDRDGARRRFRGVRRTSSCARSACRSIPSRRPAC